MICEHVGQLVVLRCWCGIQHAIPDNLHNSQLRQFDDGLTVTPIFCPLGHRHIPSGEPKHKKLERDLQRERQRLDQARAELRDKDNALNAQKAAKSRIKNRIANGVCPCCSRSFRNLHQHMKNQHPEFIEEAK